MEGVASISRDTCGMSGVGKVVRRDIAGMCVELPWIQSDACTSENVRHWVVGSLVGALSRTPSATNLAI